MYTDKKIKESILLRAERLLHYNNLLIEQCNSWLPEGTPPPAPPKRRGKSGLTKIYKRRKENN